MTKAIYNFSVFLRYTDSDYPFGIFKLFIHTMYHANKTNGGMFGLQQGKMLYKFCGSPMITSNKRLRGRNCCKLSFMRIHKTRSTHLHHVTKVYNIDNI